MTQIALFAKIEGSKISPLTTGSKVDLLVNLHQSGLKFVNDLELGYFKQKSFLPKPFVLIYVWAFKNNKIISATYVFFVKLISVT